MSPVRSSSPSVAGPGSLSIFSSAASNDQILQQPGTSSLVGRLLSNSPMKSRENLGHPLPPLDSESEEISALALKCLGHLFSWIPLSTTITPSLVSTVFYLAEFGCSVVPSSSSSSVVGNAQLGKYVGEEVWGIWFVFLSPPLKIWFPILDLSDQSITLLLPQSILRRLDHYTYCRGLYM